MLIDIMNNETLLIITADHGMHISDNPEEYRIGIHGESTWTDMIVPIIIARK